MKDEDRTGAIDTNRHVGTEPTPVLWMPDMPAVVDRLAELRRSLVSWATSAGLPRDQVNDLALAAYEAMSNVIDHAYPHSPGRFDLRAERQDDRVTVTVVDYGTWKYAEDNHSPEPGLRGRGLTLMRGLSSEFELVHKAEGTLIRMSWPLPATQAGQGANAADTSDSSVSTADECG